MTHTPATAADLLSADSKRDFALIVPAFDEAPVIRELVREVRSAFQTYGLAGQVIIVDDGSTDGTADAALDEAAGWPLLRVVRHRTNLGKTEALLTGAAVTDRTWLILFDADLQHLPEEIPRLLAKAAEGWDMVTGRKVGAYDKRAVSSIYNALGRRLFEVPVSDMNSIKVFRKEILDGLALRHDWHRYLVVLAHDRGWRIAEIDVDLHPRRAGVSKYRGPGRILVGVLDLLSVGFLLRFAGKPMLLFGSIGAGVLGLGVATGLVALWMRFVMEMGFRPLLYLVSLLVTLGVLLIGTGFIAELVAQLRDEVAATRRAIRLADRGGARAWEQGGAGGAESGADRALESPRGQVESSGPGQGGGRGGPSATSPGTDADDSREATGT